MVVTGIDAKEHMFYNVINWFWGQQNFLSPTKEQQLCLQQGNDRQAFICLH